MMNVFCDDARLFCNDLGEGGGRALAQALRLNITLTSLNICWNGMGEEVQSAPGQAWVDKGGSLCKPFLH